MIGPLLTMHRHNAGALSTEDTTRYLGLYAAFFAGILAASIFNVGKYLR
jgi:hypothetical protein